MFPVDLGAVARVHLPRLLARRTERATGAVTERVGALLGRVHGDEARVSRLALLTNRTQSEGEFIVRWPPEVACGPTEQLLGILHTHPGASPVPSPDDLHQIRAAPWIWIIAGGIPLAGSPFVALAWRRGAVRRLPLTISATAVARSAADGTKE